MVTNSKNEVKIVFLAHWVENWNWLLNWVKDLHENPQHAGRWRMLAPFYYLASIVYLVGSAAYDVVDTFKLHDAKGETWLIRNFAWHFLKASWRKRIRRRILDAVLDAQRTGATVLGFGALTKAEWLTAGGKYVVDKLGPSLKIPVVHGDTLTAAVVIKQAEALIERFELKGTQVFVTGATSKIGRAIVLSLAEKGYTILMFSESRARVEEIRAEAGDAANRIHHATRYSDGRDAKVWITGKAENGAGKKILNALPSGAVVLNFSVPDPLTPSLLKRRPDIRHFDGGLMRYSTEQIKIRFTMRLKPGVTYACHAGTMVHGLEGWTHHEVGPVDMTEIWHVWHCAVKHGFGLPAWTSHFEPVHVPDHSAVRDEGQFPVAAAG